MRKQLASLIFLFGAIALGQAPRPAIPGMTALCLNPSNQWIPLLAAGAGGGTVPYGGQRVPMYGQANGVPVPLQCDAQGNLTFGANNITGNLGVSGTVSAGAVSSCTGTPSYCLTWTATNPGGPVNIDWSQQYLGITKSLHADLEINGSTLNTNSASPNYTCSGVVVDAGYTCSAPITNGPNYAFETLTPTSPSAMQAAYGNGFVSTMKAAGTAFSGDGDSFSNLGSNSQITPSSSTPLSINSASGSVSGNAAGWSGLATVYWSGLPVWTSWTQFPSSSDFANVRVWLGMCRLCTSTNLNADATNGGSGPSGPTAMAMLSWSTVRGDSVWQCVSTADGVTYTVQAITGATPSTSGSYKKITLTNSGVTCQVGANSVTNTTNIPSALTNNGSIWEISITQTAAAVNLRTDGYYMYNTARSF